MRTTHSILLIVWFVSECVLLCSHWCPYSANSGPWLLGFTGWLNRLLWVPHSHFSRLPPPLKTCGPLTLYLSKQPIRSFEDANIGSQNLVQTWLQSPSTVYNRCVHAPVSTVQSMLIMNHEGSICIPLWSSLSMDVWKQASSAHTMHMQECLSAAMFLSHNECADALSFYQACTIFPAYYI